MRRVIILICLAIFLFPAAIKAQGLNCYSAAPVCFSETQSIIVYPGDVNGYDAETGPDYGCLYTQPNAAWFYFAATTPGNLQLRILGLGGYDVDFACWGPFSSLQSACSWQLICDSITQSHQDPGPTTIYPVGTMIDCSYSTAAEEWCYIPNAAVGDVYVLLVSNYANVHQNILIEMNDSTISNTGQIWCIQPSDTSDTSVLRICQADTLYLYSPVYDSAEYYWYGPQGFFSNDSVVVIGNIQPTSSGAYTNLVIRDSLIVYNTIYVEVEPLPESSFTAHNLGSDAAYYQILYTADSNVFYYGDGDSVLNVTFPTTLIHQYSDSGIYNATLIGFSVCGNDTVTVPMVITFASAPVIPPNTITLAPNPTTGICRISGLDGEDISLIQVRSADGRLLLSEKPDPSATVVDLTHYSPGVYFLTVQTKTETYRARILRIAQQ